MALCEKFLAASQKGAEWSGLVSRGPAGEPLSLP